MIGIIDYGMGNLRSVQKAFEHVGAEARIVSDAGSIGSVERLVLPGVGAFADGMEHLRVRGLIEPIKTFIASGRPMLGICLGMQLLFESSEEDAPSPAEPVPGLAVLPGRVVRFASGRMVDGQVLKVPHMGWNALLWQRPDPLLQGLERGDAVYFVHSYYVRPGQQGSDAEIASAWCDYGGRFCASIWRGNLWATQFHPEKSQRVGLTMLASFVRTSGG